MFFVSGAGATNVDLLYQGMERIPDVGEELTVRISTFSLAEVLLLLLSISADSVFLRELQQN